MPLAIPPADERTFASLMADARSRIPRLAPEWTDHNAHDPGITLLELLAYLTEADLYRLGRVTAAERRAFLRWFGVEASGPTVAETVVALELPRGQRVASAVAEGREITSDAADLVFSTAGAVMAQPGGITAVFAEERAIYQSASSVVAAVLPEPVSVLGPLGNEPLVIALDQPLQGELSLYVWTGASDHDDDARRRLQAEAADITREREGWRSACPPSRLDDWTRHYEVELAWEAYTRAGWAPATVVEDQTRALSLSGFVRLRVDVALAAGGVTAVPSAYAVRVRLARGRYDAPPVLRALLLNAVPVRHQSRSFRVPLGSSDGRAGQSLRVPRSWKSEPAGVVVEVPAPGVPLVFDESELTVTPRRGAPEAWSIAADWDRAGNDTPVAVLDPDAAEVHFGNGLRGRVPPQGAQLELLSRVGGGAGGNAPARALKRLKDEPTASAPSVHQPFAARGGGPPPSITELQARVLAKLARQTRAVTLDDFERLARETPGIPGGRAHAVAEHHPDFAGLPAPGCVTVVVVPRGVGAGPTPTPGFLGAVRRYLGRRRPVTTEVHVVAPAYTAVAVRARLHLGPSAEARAVIAEANARLDAFFHALTGGPEGEGWPVGRDVYRSEVLALLQDLAGVHHVDELLLLVGAQREPLCHDVCICATHLVAANPHELTIAAARIR